MSDARVTCATWARVTPQARPLVNMSATLSHSVAVRMCRSAYAQRRSARVFLFVGARHLSDARVTRALWARVAPHPLVMAMAQVMAPVTTCQPQRRSASSLERREGDPGHLRARHTNEAREVQPAPARALQAGEHVMPWRAAVIGLVA